MIFRRKAPGAIQQAPVVSPQIDTYVSADERLATAIRAFRTEAHAAEIQRAEQDAADISDAKAVIERARRWLVDTGVGDAACRVSEAARPWPSWVMRADWPKWNWLSVTEVSGERGFHKPVYFTSHNHRWCFHQVAEQHHYGLDVHGQFASLKLRVNDAEVLSITIYKSDIEGDPWRFSSVQSLAPGAWAAALTEMDIELELARRKVWAESEAERLRLQASGLNLP